MGVQAQKGSHPTGGANFWLLGLVDLAMLPTDCLQVNRRKTKKKTPTTDLIAGFSIPIRAFNWWS
jgi:hypothetical protein